MLYSGRMRKMDYCTRAVCTVPGASSAAFLHLEDPTVSVFIYESSADIQMLWGISGDNRSAHVTPGRSPGRAAASWLIRSAFRL
ncbi:hypothetical protein CMUS01_15035 [Colletotrichum musicola]|uniref:Uncharacterized protein n=1 Tax=Colletotrichum musicola TaxID=2175873 RepID=A0A8H6IZQ6_9PEZI|nr:hypothetical protein CMUS01_15035 [Colletotrichum musicola]